MSESHSSNTFIELVKQLAHLDQSPDTTPAPTPVASELTTTLLVGDFESRCGNCDKPTLVHEVDRHTDVSGWEEEPGAGCGARFTTIASASRNVTAADLRQLRPDLPIRDH
ncbi:hypothetical protein ACFYNX_26350 [Streptomyces sp. NPDC007872]|uniref:hypothetical protein n=1 Tax=Streptomyces sp. NPDC007872 TaxID=3364782 RepID=UPI0036D171DE